MAQADRVHSTPPTNTPTSRRRMALLEYSISADQDGETWPQSLLSGDGETGGSWHRFLIQNLTEVLPGLLRSTGDQS
jgi:hypothetical protein